METPRIDVKEIIDELRTTRDELRVQMHLAAAGSSGRMGSA